MNTDSYQKYLKYKKKYLESKANGGGTDDTNSILHPNSIILNRIISEFNKNKDKIENDNKLIVYKEYDNNLRNKGYNKNKINQILKNNILYLQFDIKNKEDKVKEQDINDINIKTLKESNNKLDKELANTYRFEFNRRKRINDQIKSNNIEITNLTNKNSDIDKEIFLLRENIISYENTIKEYEDIIKTMDKLYFDISTSINEYNDKIKDEDFLRNIKNIYTTRTFQNFQKDIIDYEISIKNWNNS